jgi:hypothetical protein
MAKRKATGAARPGAKAAVDSSVPPKSFNPAEAHVVYRADLKHHVNGGWLARNWAGVTATALRIVSLATGKEVFARAAEVTGAIGGAEK